MNQQQAKQQPGGRADNKKNRINSDLLTGAGPFSNIEIQCPRDHVANTGSEKKWARIRRNDGQDDANDRKALQNAGHQNDKALRGIESLLLACILVTSEKAKRILRPPGQKTEHKQHKRSEDQRFVSLQ